MKYKNGVISKIVSVALLITIILSLPFFPYSAQAADKQSKIEPATSVSRFTQVIEAKELVTWYQTDFPPYLILDGQSKGNGIDDRIGKYIIQRMPEYDYTYKVANYSRILVELKKQNPGVATPFFKTPEREQYILYSEIASYLILPNRLIIRRVDIEKYQPFLLSDGTVDIEAVCNSGLFEIGISKGRSYYGILDEMIKKYKDTNVFHVRSGANHLGLLEMVKNGRIDSAFGFPVEVKYADLGADLIALRVAKMVRFIPVYFGVPKNDWGQNLVGKLNSILKAEGTLAEFNSYYEFWLDETDKGVLSKTGTRILS